MAYKQLNKREVAALWLYHDDYTASCLPAHDFYKQLPKSKKDNIDRMLREIENAK